MDGVRLNINLIDAVMLGVIVRGIYVGCKSGLIAELFRLIGAVCSTFIILHYDLPLGRFLQEKLFISEKIQEFVAFVLLMAATFVLFFIMREGWLVIFKADPKLPWNKWGGAILSLATSYFVCGLLFLALVLFNNGFFNQQMGGSFSRRIWSQTSAKAYKACYDAFVRPFFPVEEFNPRMLKPLKEEPPAAPSETGQQDSSNGR